MKHFNQKQRSVYLFLQRSLFANFRCLQLNLTPKVKQIFLVLTVINLSGCFNQTGRGNVLQITSLISDSIPKNYDDTLTELENKSMALNYDSLGELISKIRFDIKTKNSKEYKNGIIPSIRIDSPQLDIKNLIEKDKIVIHETKVIVIIDYPLSENYKFKLFSQSGFSRTQLINEITKHYYQLYEEEENTSTIKTIPPKERKGLVYNRNKTNGKYGIWGHDISDLVLDEIHVYKNTIGEIFLILQLES